MSKFHDLYSLSRKDRVVPPQIPAAPQDYQAGLFFESWQEQKFTSKCLSLKRTMRPRFGLFQLGEIWNVHYPESRCFIFTMILDISPYGRSFSSSNRRAAKPEHAFRVAHPPKYQASVRRKDVRNCQDRLICRKACQTIHPMSPFKADEDILKS